MILLKTFLTWLWALVPLFSLGGLTPVVMAHAAARKRSLLQAASVPVYVAGVVALLAFSDEDAPAWQETLFVIALGVNMLVGTAHAIMIRSWTFSGGASSLRDEQKLAVSAHLETAKAREAARGLVLSQPTLARELLIGRPDVPGRTYPDGGLIDINHVAAETLASHLGVSLDLARRVVEIRDMAGGFASYEELSYYLGEDKAFIGHVDRLVYVPRA